MSIGNQELLYRVEDHIATVTMNRPERLNALSPAMIAGLYDALVAAQEDNEVRVIVLTGAGRGFCSGMDVRARAEADRGAAQRPAPSTAESTRGVALHGIQRVQAFATLYLEKPYIAMVNGPAAGGGFDTASFADIRIVSDQARGGINHAKMGLVSPDGGYWPLARLVGTAKTMEMAFTARLYTAQELKEMGWANYLVPHDQLVDFTYSLARDIIQWAAPTAVRFAKHLIRRALDQDLLDHLREVGLAMAICNTTEDAKEGPRAFVEGGRPPQFTGR